MYRWSNQRETGDCTSPSSYSNCKNHTGCIPFYDVTSTHITLPIDEASNMSMTIIIKEFDQQRCYMLFLNVLMHLCSWQRWYRIKNCWPCNNSAVMMVVALFASQLDNLMGNKCQLCTYDAEAFHDLVKISLKFGFKV